MRPQDIVVLLKISAAQNRPWNTNFLGKHGKVEQLLPQFWKKDVAIQLNISSSEITESLHRSAYAGLYDPNQKKVMAQALFEFLRYGLKYVFPQQPGALVRGFPTAHSAKPLSELIQSDEPYVWPSAEGTVRGQAIEPLYPTVVQAVANDPLLYELLALVDAVRVGKAREVKLAVDELAKRLQVTK